MPDDLQTPAPGTFATLTDFNPTIKGTFKKTPYVGLTGCTGGELAFAYKGEHTDPSDRTIDITQACK